MIASRLSADECEIVVKLYQYKFLFLELYNIFFTHSLKFAMSSSDASDDDIPEVAECQRLCEKFAEITGTDEARAQLYLQDRKWDLDQSVNDYFKDISNKGGLRVNDKNEAQVVVVVDSSSESLAAAATAELAESALCHSSGMSPSRTRIKSSALKFITWNIEGLSKNNLLLRTKAVCETILNEKADIVFCQEIVPETAEYFSKHLTEYHCIFGRDIAYFVGTFLKKSTIKYKQQEILVFPETIMMRNCLKIEVTYNNIPMHLFNTHLESTSERAEERKKQLKFMFKEVLATPDDCTAIFAGDLNLKDIELIELGGLPAGMEDLWIACGRRKECAYTFDMTRNDNLNWKGWFKLRCRFDRAYIRHSSPRNLHPVHFGLIGLERLLPHGCFPSDHWGILTHFEMQQN